MTPTWIREEIRTLPTTILERKSNEIIKDPLLQFLPSCKESQMDIQFYLDVLCVLSLTSQKLKKALVRFCKLLVMKPENVILLLSKKLEV